MIQTPPEDRFSKFLSVVAIARAQYHVLVETVHDMQDKDEDIGKTRNQLNNDSAICDIAQRSI